ncbi:methyltransferase domain-containing protein [bacterium]|nr:methyltransferase domain-containing protein [bacterium]
MSQSASDPTTRFTSRVDDYVRWRPGYPQEVLSTLVARTGIHPPATVADIGVGTGISSEMLLSAGFDVISVEPNTAMRSAAERQFAENEHWHSVPGTAEATTLPDGSVDLVLAAQAFHWFDPVATKREWQRILRPPGWVALLWNARRLAATPFLRDYEQMLITLGTDYNTVRHENVDAERLNAFFDGEWTCTRFESVQPLTREGYLGRLRSSSYVPGPDHPRHAAMVTAAEKIFAEHQTDGTVTFEYDTQLYLGHLSPAPGK